MCILPGNFREISFHFYFPNFWEHIWSICVSVHGVMFCTQPYMETNSYHIKMKRWQHLHFGINDNDNLDKNSMCAESEWLIMHPITKSMILSHSMLYGFLWSGTEEVFKDELISVCCSVIYVEMNENDEDDLFVTRIWDKKMRGVHFLSI